MILTQLSVKIPNKPGQLSKLSDLLGDQRLNVKALNAAASGQDAQIHLVLDDVDRAREALKLAGYEFTEHKVLAVETPDHPGGLNAILRPLKDADINVEYLYPAIGKSRGNAVIIVGGAPIEMAVRALQKDYLTILDHELFGL